MPESWMRMSSPFSAMASATMVASTFWVVAVGVKVRSWGSIMGVSPPGGVLSVPTVTSSLLSSRWMLASTV